MPGYSVPCCTPEIWLIRTPPDPSGTTTMLNATSSGAHAHPNHFLASGQRMGRRGPACPAAPSSPEPISFWNCIARYTSYATTPAAVPNIATPAAINNHFSANMAFPSVPSNLWSCWSRGSLTKLRWAPGPDPIGAFSVEAEPTPDPTVNLEWPRLFGDPSLLSAD